MPKLKRLYVYFSFCCPFNGDSSEFFIILSVIITSSFASEK